MKKMISVLAVALFAVTFAAGCGTKRPDCAKLTKKEDCQKDGDNKLTCRWTDKDAADATKGGTCAAAADADICKDAGKDKCADAAKLVEKGSCKVDGDNCVHNDK